MLNIRRRTGESVLIGDNVEIQILEIAGNRVKIGIAAPRDVLVLRKELRLTEEFNVEASKTFQPENVLSVVAKLPGVLKTRKHAGS